MRSPWKKLAATMLVVSNRAEYVGVGLSSDSNGSRLWVTFNFLRADQRLAVVTR